MTHLSGEGVEFENCTAIGQAAGGAGGGFTGHINVAGTFGIAKYKNCSVLNMSTGWSAGDATLELENPICSGVAYALFVYSDVTVTGGTLTATHSVLNPQIDGHTYTFTDVIMTNSVASQNVISLVARNTTTLNFIDCSIISAQYLGIWLNGTDNVLNVSGCTFECPNNLWLQGTYTVTSDYNSFKLIAGADDFYVDTAAKTFAEWQALGYDAHSITV